MTRIVGAWWRPANLGPPTQQKLEVVSMSGYGVQVKKVCDSPKNFRIENNLEKLLREFETFDLDPEDWREVFEAILKHLTELNERWKLLEVIYRAVSVRSDYVTASKVVGKVLKNFDLLFEKLPGTPAYFVPTEAGMWLFEQLIEPEKREEVRAEAGKHIATVQQLSLVTFLRGVRA